MSATAARRADTRSRIIEIAARRLREEGPAAVTTRGIAELAGVQAPMIYRLFGDKDGLLEAVAEHVMADLVAGKAAAAAGDDPVADLRTAWQHQIAFGLANPALFRLLSDPGRVRRSPAARTGREHLQERIHRIAATGRLRVSEQRAAGLLESAAIGTIQVLLAAPPEERDPGLAAGMYDAVLAQILDVAPPPATGPVTPAVAVRAAAPGLEALTPVERQMLAEWLDRVIAHGSGGVASSPA
ncbi:TetR/AcrR family transcriptional regulator [Actinoplanes bogorensis]|uniref:TetR/AcrR family transcriptional regulator n=1 Tax=Paractinoplanes bogorensis TaxID=1610840 RepID=A0ABS5YMR8_9ACTN|nr:TetR/AcrR family transcriptional regulator [Actinoplanes bogorensis]MBU2664752.1 TetR/AcrR family transcriptional regulator [Actinoplanes bogorensis]